MVLLVNEPETPCTVIVKFPTTALALGVMVSTLVVEVLVELNVPATPVGSPVTVSDIGLGRLLAFVTEIVVFVAVAAEFCKLIAATDDVRLNIGGEIITGREIVWLNVPDVPIIVA